MIVELGHYILAGGRVREREFLGAGLGSEVEERLALLEDAAFPLLDC